MDTNQKTVTVIIPTLNAGPAIGELLTRLQKQTHPVTRILIPDSGSTDGTPALCRSFPGTKILPVPPGTFDHGLTRDLTARLCDTDHLLFMTQDALPCDETLVERMLAPFSDPGVAVVTARQLARSDARPAEKLVRLFNYPDRSAVRTANDLQTLGIKTFFSSDVCAAYDRKLFLGLGGFDHPLRTNEDMLFAAKAIRSGYSVVYAADARVIHSHDLSLREQYRRNFDQGYEMARFADRLEGCNATDEGKRLVRFVAAGLLKHGRIFSLIGFVADCAARFLGNRAGKKAFYGTNKSKKG